MSLPSQQAAVRDTEPAPVLGCGLPLFAGEVDPQQGQPDQEEDEGDRAGDDEPRVARATDRLPADAAPEDERSVTHTVRRTSAVTETDATASLTLTARA